MIDIDLQKNKINSNTNDEEKIIEAILINRPYYDAPIITSRICANCSISHNLASILAIENALKIKNDRNTTRLREILVCSQIVPSHISNLYSYVLDSKNKNLIKGKDTFSKKITQIKSTFDHISRQIAGRSIHPLTPQVGGFTKIPSRPELRTLLSKLKNISEDIIFLANFFSSLNYPVLSNPTAYLSLSSATRYPIMSEKIELSSGRTFSTQRYEHNIIEKIRTNSPYKYATQKGKPFMLGALARLSINSHKLHPIAKDIYKRSKEHLGNFPAYNSFHNIFAKSVEVVQYYEEISSVLKKIIADKNYKPRSIQKIKTKNSTGYATIESSHGIIYHSYKLSSTGKITHANIITPTNANIYNFESDVKALLKQNKNLSQKETADHVKLLTNAYDLCSSCLAH